MDRLDTFSYFVAVFFIVSMLGIFFESVYQRYLITKGELLLTVKIKRGWLIYSAFISVVFGAAALFFSMVGVISLLKHRDFGIMGWLLLISAVLFFGKVAIDTSPWRAKLILTEKGIICTHMAARWDKITDYKWVKPFGTKTDVLRISVNIFGVRTPLFPMYGLLVDQDTIKAINEIFEAKLNKRFPSDTV
jgi:hypothetical protein